MGVTEDRRRIIAAQPHLVTASGSAVLVTIAEPKIERLKVTFSPTQTGSGTPSPSNVRPIYGWGTIMASIGTVPVDIPLGGTYYGGTVDLVSGTMTVTWGNIASYSGQSLPGRWLSSKDAYVSGGTPTTGAQVAYELATPQTVQLTPQTILALRGQQTVTSPAGSVEIGYWAQDDTVRQMSYGGIPVWMDNAYFETGGKGAATSVVENNDWFIAGYFDTGDTTSKSYTWLSIPTQGNVQAAWRIYNDQSGTSSATDWWPSATWTADQTKTGTSSGRYILFSVYKPRAADFYLMQGSTYIFKGNNVT